MIIKLDKIKDISLKEKFMIIDCLKRFFKNVLPYSVVHLYQKYQAFNRFASQSWAPLERNHDHCILIANGPSTNRFLPEISIRKADYDIITVNWSLNDERIRSLQPHAHICIDSTFFKNTEKRNLFSDILSHVTWNMRFYLNEEGYNYYTLCDLPQNIIVRSVPTSYPPFLSEIEKIFSFLDNGKCGCGGMNVLSAALFLAVNAGYKKIFCSGIDASYRKNFTVDEYCRLIVDHMHFYDKNNALFLETMDVGWMYYLELKFILELELVKMYTDFKKCQIINLCEESLHDMFEKGNLDGLIYESKRSSPRLNVLEYLNKLYRGVL